MNEVVLFIFLALIPGFISMIIILNNVIHKNIEPTFFVIYSAIIGFFSYVLYDLVQNLLVLILNKYRVGLIIKKNLSIWSLLGNDAKKWSLNINEILIACIFGIIIAFILIALINHKIINKLLQKIKITTKYGDESLFYYYLNTKEINWVYIRDEEKHRIIQGRLHSFSESSTYQEILLYDVTVFNNKRKPDELYKVPSMYICYEYGKMHIEQIPKENFEGEDNLNDKTSK